MKVELWRRSLGDDEGLVARSSRDGVGGSMILEAGTQVLARKPQSEGRFHVSSGFDGAMTALGKVNKSDEG